MAIFLYVGHSNSVKTRDIVGIFDMDTSTVSRVTKNFLSASQKRGEVENTTTEIPKSFILYDKNKKQTAVCISQLSSFSIASRAKKTLE